MSAQQAATPASVVAARPALTRQNILWDEPEILMN
jgi:hypothetical protein